VAVRLGALVLTWTTGSDSRQRFRMEAVRSPASWIGLRGERLSGLVVEASRLLHGQRSTTDPMVRLVTAALIDRRPQPALHRELIVELTRRGRRWSPGHCASPRENRPGRRQHASTRAVPLGLNPHRISPPPVVTSSPPRNPRRVSQRCCVRACVMRRIGAHRSRTHACDQAVAPCAVGTASLFRSRAMAYAVLPSVRFRKPQATTVLRR
jgi:hypothetical protein